MSTTVAEPPPGPRPPGGAPAPAGLGVARGTALYVGSLLGPGLLLVPALAVQAAGPASVIAWVALLALSAPLAITFATLGVRHPVDGGVSVYVREGLGPRAAAAAGVCFLTAVVIGGPAVALVGGSYVAHLLDAGTGTAVTVAAGMIAVVVAVNLLGLRVSSGVQLALAAVLVVALATAISVALPARGGDNWSPFAPHGWWAVGTAANLLVWHFIGWEAMAQLAGEFRDPERDIPRAVAAAFGVIVVLYLGLAAATVAVTSGTTSTVPLADLLEVGFGEAGRTATVGLALALTLGTMNVYYAAGAKLAGALARDGALPASVGGGGGQVPRRPLLFSAVSGAVMLAALGADLIDVEGLVRATSACFIAVYVLALASATRILSGPARVRAAVALVSIAAVGVFSGGLLLVPLAASALAVVRLRRRPSRST